MSQRFDLGEGLVGQAALEKKRIVVSDLPHGYVAVGSGLGRAQPRSLVTVRIVFEDEVKATRRSASRPVLPITWPSRSIPTS